MALKIKRQGQMDIKYIVLYLPTHGALNAACYYYYYYYYYQLAAFAVSSDTIKFGLPPISRVVLRLLNATFCCCRLYTFDVDPIWP